MTGPFDLDAATRIPVTEAADANPYADDLTPGLCEFIVDAVESAFSDWIGQQFGIPCNDGTTRLSSSVLEPAHDAMDRFHQWAAHQHHHTPNPRDRFADEVISIALEMLREFSVASTVWNADHDGYILDDETNVVPIRHGRSS